MKGWILGAMLGLAVPAQAQPYSILGPGNRSCSEWLAADEKGAMKLVMLGWLGGYVTASHINLESDPKLYEELVTTYCEQQESQARTSSSLLWTSDCCTDRPSSV